MNIAARHRRWAWPLVVLVVVVSLIALVPQLAHTKGTRGPLWTDRPLTAPVASTVAAPNWPEIAKALKPAVVKHQHEAPGRGGTGPRAIRRARSVQ